VVTDLAEVRRLGAAKRAENVAFRRYLAAHHRPVEPFQILAVEIQQHVDCTTCANCCRYSVVSVGQAEMEAIGGHLGLGAEEVRQRFTEPDRDAATSRVLKSNKKGCVFLEGNRCTIYPARPKACRDFPHLAVGTHSLGGRVSSLCRWAAWCPIIYNALESYKRVTGYHHSKAS